MKKIVCVYCGGNRIRVGTNTCEYCGASYDVELASIINEKPHSWKMHILLVSGTLLILVITLFVLELAAFNKIETVSNKSKNLNQAEAQSSISSSSSDSQKEYSERKLQNPSKNVLVAEFSLNPNDIILAEESVRKYGGNEKSIYEKRLASAKNQSNTIIKNRSKQIDNPEQLVQNTDEEYTRIYYFRQNGVFEAVIPDFTQYSAEDIIKMWGEPDEIITSEEDIKKNLGVYVDKTTSELTTEGKILWENYYKTGAQGDDNLTWRELRAFATLLNDALAGSYEKALIYTQQGKPNLYFDDEGKIYYVSPIMSYLAIERIPNNFHPYEGLGKYPDDYPSNYPIPGTWEIIGEEPK